jgi:hypothetical protein
MLQSIWAIQQSPEQLAKLSPEARKFVDWIGSQGMNAGLAQVGISAPLPLPAAFPLDMFTGARGVIRERSAEANKRHREYVESLRQPSRQNEPVTQADIQAGLGM